MPTWYAGIRPSSQSLDAARLLNTAIIWLTGWWFYTEPYFSSNLGMMKNLTTTCFKWFSNLQPVEWFRTSTTYLTLKNTFLLSAAPDSQTRPPHMVWSPKTWLLAWLLPFHTFSAQPVPYYYLKGTTPRQLGFPFKLLTTYTYYRLVGLLPSVKLCCLIFCMVYTTLHSICYPI